MCILRPELKLVSSLLHRHFKPVRICQCFSNTVSRLSALVRISLSRDVKTNTTHTQRPSIYTMLMFALLTQGVQPAQHGSLVSHPLSLHLLHRPPPHQTTSWEIPGQKGIYILPVALVLSEQTSF